MRQARAYHQFHKAGTDGLVVIFDNDVELLSNYWLLHVQKAFHAIRVNKGDTDVVTGLRVINCDEYGFRYTGTHEALFVPSGENSMPRCSFSTVIKDSSETDHLLDETVVMGWTDFITGNSVIAIPAALLKSLPLDDQFPLFIGGVDSYFSACIQKSGAKMGYIENGPVARHNDWPYTEEKIAAYEAMKGRRASLDLHYLRWKFRDFRRRLGI